MIVFQYVLLHFLLLVTIIYFCRKISFASNDALYWKYATIPIIAYTIEEGLRWGRETDWSLYYKVYSILAGGEWTNHEFLFQILWKAFAFCGLPYPAVISICSFLFIFSLFFFLKNYKEVIWIALPLCVANHLIAASNLIRWYTAISFFLISLGLINRKKTLAGYVLLMLSFFFHYGMAPIGLIYLLCKNCKCIAKPFWAVVTCLALIFLFDKSVLSHFSVLYNIFNGIGRFAMYFDHGMERLMQQAHETKSIAITLFTFIPFFAFIIYGYKLKLKRVITDCHYNLIVLASYIKIVSDGLEIFIRYYRALDFFICLGAAYVFSYLRKNYHLTQQKIFLVFVCFYIVRKFIFMMQPYEYDEYMLYLWNSNRMDPMDIYYFRQSLR